MKARTALAMFALVAGAPGAMADVETLVPDSGVPEQGAAKFNVSIRNATTLPVRFILRPKGATWTTYSLSPGEKGVYSCIGCGGTFEVSVSTDGNVVTYDVTAGVSYDIRINSTRHIFDLYRTE
jgi:hypothetical protein